MYSQRMRLAGDVTCFVGKCHFALQCLAESDANTVSSLRQTAFQVISLPWELETS